MENQNTVGAQFKAIRILHIALCVSLAIVLWIIRYLVKQHAATTIENNIIFEIIGVAIGFINVLAARLLFFMRTKAALSVISLKEKINIFRSAFIIQMAILEGAALLNGILYFITKYDLHFFISLGILLLMAFRRPTKAIAAMVLFNSMQDKQQIYDDQLEL